MGFYNTFGRHYSSNRGTGYSTAAPKIMQARYAGRCLDCGGPIAVGDTIRYASGQVRHASPDVCKVADASRAALAASICSNGAEANRLAPSAGSTFRGLQPAPAAAVDLSAIRAFIQAAKDRGLKFPKLRVLDADGQTELTLGLTVAGHNPGSVSVKRNGRYLGLIRQDGTTKGAIDARLAVHLVAVAQAPAAAAKAYAVLMCRCSFCGLALTDEASVELGYGPVCAKHWGLPHKAKGTKAPVALAEPTTEEFIAQRRALAARIEADERAMQALEAAGDRAQTAREAHHTMMEVA